jgi:hypothetical protein
MIVVLVISIGFLVPKAAAPQPEFVTKIPWQQEAGPTVFAPFEETSAYFGDAHKGWMVNFRVRNLDRMAAQLRAIGEPRYIGSEVGNRHLRLE